MENSENETSRTNELWRREEIRGLFVGVVVASLLAGRNYYEGKRIEFPLLSFNLEGFIYILIAFWGIYIFFMVIAFSSDFLPYYICSYFQKLAGFFLFSGFLYLIYFGLVFFIIGHLNKWKDILAVSLPLMCIIVYLIIQKIRTIESFFNFSMTPKCFLMNVSNLIGYGWAIFSVIFLVNLISPKSIDFLSSKILNSTSIFSLMFGIVWVLTIIYIDKLDLQKEHDRVHDIRPSYIS